MNAANDVAAEQWWVYLTAPLEIEPIPYGTLRNAEHGHLLLRGRSGHYLQPETIQALDITAKNTSEQDELDRVATTPTGRADLPRKDQITFDVWQELAAGALTLEADVSNAIVEPMLRWAIEQDEMITRVLHGWQREVKTAAGFVDFVLNGEYGPSGARPVLAIEVKLAVRCPRSGRWLESPDFQQVRRYMDEMNVNGMLIDAHSIYLIERGAAAPTEELRRKTISRETLLNVLRYFPIHRTERGTWTHRE